MQAWVCIRQQSAQAASIPVMKASIGDPFQLTVARFSIAGTMKGTLATICVLGLVAFTATAATPTKKVSRADTPLKVRVNLAADEAFQLGEILRSVAREMAEDNELGIQNEEYFIRAIWEKITVAVSNVTETVKGVMKGAYDEATNRITKAASDANKKLRVKTAEILSKMITKAIVGYALEDTESHINFVKNLCEDIDRVGQRLIRQSKALRTADN
ncbi:hypothetical protein HPB49_011251 [Dermacentor silvarum]|uniref:Uncharacterized protein n=1 Tax=Dermacentor silvarum TaxID=543639 RepID=A0ACB8DCW8_DERSI|nr:hypothetical protein HPB49_011251 [Dermacentor silvarum]